MKTTMKAKKLLAVMLAGALALSAAGCGGGGTSSTSGTSSTGGTSSTSETSSEAGESSAETSETTAKSDATLEIWVYGWEKASADKVAEDVAAYEEETGVKVTVTPIANDSYSTKIQALSPVAPTPTWPLWTPVCRACSWPPRASCWA